MSVRRLEWRKRLYGLMAITRRLVLVTVGLWPVARRKGVSVDHEWEIISLQEIDDVQEVDADPITTSPLRIRRSTEEAHKPSPSLQNQINSTYNGSHRSAELYHLVNLSGSGFLGVQEERGRTKRFTLREFSFTIQCAPSELPEDVERLIFEMTAREDPVGALNTLVFVNNRVRKWVEYIIYESVILRDAKHARLFLDGLERKHPDFASGAVKILALPTRVSFNTSKKILTICRNIHHLSWLPTNLLPPEILDLVAGLTLISLRARLSTFIGTQPDFSAPLFRGLKTLFVVDHQDVWGTWRWDSIRKNSSLKWLAFNLDGRLETSLGWAPVRTLEDKMLKPYGGDAGIRLCICYSYDPRVSGDRWIHRSKDTFSEERIAVLSLGGRVDEREWETRVSGQRRDFEISEELVQERQTEDRRLKFQRYRTSLLF
ncbi:hypothetical protein HYPSUDRAFT_36218 [Hypholoma sublateritium FD-334 SS-4]|uniref:Uncharacterized protein n=1 Tax=Hypholoma sublateritium (strain FD-334 SS-4) TaxID=945553 RepID=A0A0D2MR79_HYPSF|nr:hypothetical protein HYPSUDRAFT_36218 [Hypholoma sublateritium FD-334 SS-4]